MLWFPILLNIILLTKTGLIMTSIYSPPRVSIVPCLVIKDANYDKHMLGSKHYTRLVWIWIVCTYVPVTEFYMGGGPHAMAKNWSSMFVIISYFI